MLEDKKANKFSLKDVVERYGRYTACYLTGKPIDLLDGTSYEFDHIIPRSKGGSSTIDNLGICCKEANRAKNSMQFDDFLVLCKEVVKYHT